MKHCPDCKHTFPKQQRYCSYDGKLLSLDDPYGLVGKTLINKFHIEVLVGMGGFGAVYKAHHKDKDCPVAFKILQPNVAIHNEAAVEFFRNEARLASSLAHPNIVTIHDAGQLEHDSRKIAYIAMEWLDGCTLEEELGKLDQLSFERIREILHQLAGALKAAHKKRIIHRDLKPSNLVLTRDSEEHQVLKVLDFGIAKAIVKASKALNTSLYGTVEYASPEQLRDGERIDTRSDLYTVGVMLYEMLTGELPYAPEMKLKMIQQPGLKYLKPFPAYQNIPETIKQLVFSLLSESPDERPQKIEDVFALFEQGLANAAIKEKASADAIALDRQFLKDRYHLEAEIGKGGFGVVYKAQEIKSGKTVAIKILLPDPLDHQGNERYQRYRRKAFVREANLAGLLKHENIVRFYESGSERGIAYLVMELLEGTALEKIIARGPLAFDRIDNILRQICAALAEAHKQNIVHRDLTPSNVIISQRADRSEHVKVLDFGIGKVITEIPSDTTPSIPVGKMHYVSPEQALPSRLRELDVRTDIYSLGVLLYEMLTGVRPFDHEYEESREVIGQHLAAMPPSVTKLRPEVPAAVEELIKRMLSKIPNERPHAVDVPVLFAEAIRSLSKPDSSLRTSPATISEPVTAPVKVPVTTSLPQPERVPLFRRKPVWIAASVIVMLLAGSIGYWLISRSGSRPVAGSLETSHLPARPEVLPYSHLQYSRLQWEPTDLFSTKFSFETVTLDASGREIARTSKQSPYFIEDLGNGVTLEMVEVPGGSFQMGSFPKEVQTAKADAQRYFGSLSLDWFEEEVPPHRVTLPTFFMGKFEVTQVQWRAIMGSDPSNFKGDNLPVEKVSWNDVKKFCAQLSKKTGKPYRLPSEAEWEYAARAGTTTPFAFGETITSQFVNYDGNDPYASAPKGEYRGRPIPVGSLGVPNAFGLFDLHGNVWEWCEDVWHENYKGAPTDGSAWITGSDQRSRVLRGGSWLNHGTNCRSAIRSYTVPSPRLNYNGFRVVVSVKTR